MRFAHTFLFLLISGVLLAGCKKDKPVVTFEVVDTLSTTLIASNPSAYLETTVVGSNIAIACEQNKSSVNQLQNASLSRVEISARPGQNFGPLQKIVLYVLDKQGNQAILASQSTVPKGTDKITLTPTDSSMLPYLRAKRYFVKPYVELTSSGQLVAEVKMQFTFNVEARRL